MKTIKAYTDQMRSELQSVAYVTSKSNTMFFYRASHTGSLAFKTVRLKPSDAIKTLQTLPFLKLIHKIPLNSILNSKISIDINVKNHRHYLDGQ